MTFSSTHCHCEVNHKYFLKTLTLEAGQQFLTINSPIGIQNGTQNADRFTFLHDIGLNTL